MAKLWFKFGSMGSSKTRQLHSVYYNFKYDCALYPYLVKPSLDDRDGVNITKSRDGSEFEVDLVAKGTTDIFDKIKKEMPDIVLVDEAQFLKKRQVIELRRVVDYLNIPVIAFGIKNDSFNEIFEGAKYLFVYADKFEQIKTICRNCTNSAIMNMRVFNGRPIFTGQQIMTGGDDKYVPVCSKCYEKHKQLVKDGYYD